MIQRRHAKLIGGKFSYLEAGSGEPLVLLHALGRGASDWSHVIDALAQRWHCLAIDFRGHGQSVHTATYSFDEFTLDLGRFVDDRDIDSFYLIGHSMGGNVAWRFAARRPERVRKLVIEDVAPPRGRDRYPTPPAIPPEQVDYDWMCRLRIIQELNNPDRDWWPDLDKVVCPVLVLSGGMTRSKRTLLTESGTGVKLLWTELGTGSTRTVRTPSSRRWSTSSKAD